VFVNNNTPLITAQKLEQAVNKAIDPATTIEQKSNAITDFRDHARNAKYSASTKMIVGAVIGGIVVIAFSLALAAATMGISVLFTGAPLVPAFGLVLHGLMGAGFGAVMGEKTTHKQNDARGRDVYRDLKNLATNRHSLFQSKGISPISIGTKGRAIELSPATPRPG